jgi:alpha-1,2-mannosyltransferase
LTGAIVGPVSATNELMWVLPAVLILVDAAARKRVARHRPLPGWRHQWPGAGFAAAAVFTYLLFLVAPVWTVDAALVRNSYALALILLVSCLPWRPGMAPAIAINGWIRQRSAARSIPPARRPMGS